MSVEMQSNRMFVLPSKQMNESRIGYRWNQTSQNKIEIVSLSGPREVRVDYKGKSLPAVSRPIDLLATIQIGNTVKIWANNGEWGAKVLGMKFFENKAPEIQVKWLLDGKVTVVSVQTVNSVK
jgi:hypothetical protein